MKLETAYNLIITINKREEKEWLQRRELRNYLKDFRRR